jgi:hypothetical protein
MRMTLKITLILNLSRRAGDHNHLRRLLVLFDA